MRPSRHPILAFLILLISITPCAVPASGPETRSGSTVAPENERPQPLEVLPFELYDKRVWISAKVNNKGPFDFQFDSAAGSSLLTPKAAVQAGIEANAFASASGAGDATIQVQVASDVSFRFGRISWAAQRIPLIPLDTIDEGTGRRADGLIGKDFLDRFVFEIDYANRTMSVYDPSFKYTGGAGVSLPITLAEGPIIEALISVPGRDPIRCRLLVDAPFTGSLTFARPFIEKNRLLDAAKELTPKLLKTALRGVGGESVMYMGRVQSLKVGPYSFEKPVAGFCLAEGGTLARSDIDGLLGAEILRRFRVIFDFPHLRMILEPAEGLTDAFESDMSGLEIRSVAPELKTFTVRRVYEGTPAAEAGVRVGDSITVINGWPVQDFTLPEIRQILRVPGREIRMRVLRGQEQKVVSFVLRRLI
ncbi:MAG: PDZ domain-containing protein [Acidobacteria bacterium]|nr:MAG: PDZ domain-containing protein [Acidobacteriota bacterium]